MIKILLTGHGGSQNRGCEAIVRCTIDIIRRHIRAPEITIMSLNPASDRAVMMPEPQGVNVPSVVNTSPRRYSLRWLVSGWYRRFMPGFPTYRCFANRHLYRVSDLVISIGGDNFTDDYGSPFFHFRELAFARTQGALTVIWAASIGPFHNKRFERKWARQLRKVDLITVREDLSLEYLKSIGVADNVRRVADPAFLLRANAEGAISPGSFKSNRIVGIGMSAMVSRSRYGSCEDKYIDAFATFGKALLSDANTRLVLIPHVVSKGTPDDDEVVCQQLAARLPDSDRVMLTNQKHNACQMKHMISQCDYFIGARTHSTISSLSSYVPTLSIGYSPKAYGINKLIFGHTEYVLPIAELDENSLMAKVTLLCENRSKIVKQLARRVPVLKSMAERGGECLAEVIQRHGHKIRRACTQ